MFAGGLSARAGGEKKRSAALAFNNNVDAGLKEKMVLWPLRGKSLTRNEARSLVKGVMGCSKTSCGVIKEIMPSLSKRIPSPLSSPLSGKAMNA